MALNESLQSLDSAMRVSQFQNKFESDYSFVEEVTAATHGICMNAELDETSVVLLAQEDPGIKALQVLFSEFVDIYVSHSCDSQIWDEILAYENVCGRQVKMLQKVLRKVPRHNTNFSKTEDMLYKMVGERNTWRLLRTLFLERQKETNCEEERPMIDTTKNGTDKAIISQLYEASSSMREIQNVVDWLEMSAKDSQSEQGFDPVDYFGQTHVAWENTLRAKKATEDGVRNQIASLRPLITSLDPDATCRQEKKLSELDEEEDNRLLRCVFSCIRKGNLADAQDLCAKSGQQWRAATLEGWKLFHDANERDQMHREPVQGNRYRDVWKAVAWKAANDSRLSPKERAVYGSLCGHLPAMLLVCSNFEDQMWAYFRTLADQRMEETLRESSLHLRSLHPLPKEYPEEKLTLERIFNLIENKIGSENLSFYHRLQKCLILNDVAGIVRSLPTPQSDSWYSSHQLRCLTHLVLVLKRLGAVSFELEHQVTDIVHSCVKEASERGDVEQIARYCAILPEPLQTRSFAEFLVNVSEDHHRKHALGITKAVGLDAAAITATVVAKIRLIPDWSSAADLISESSATDKAKISSIDWLLYEKTDRAEAIRQANAMMRSFLIARNITAAKALLKKIPSDSIDVVIRLQKSKTGASELPTYYDNRIKENLCYKAFLDAQESFTDWLNHFQHKKPSSPEKLGALSSFQEQLSHEHAYQQYCADHERWKHGLDLITRKTTERLYNVLLFPDGGWMVDSAPSALNSCEDTEMVIEASFSDQVERNLAADMAPEDVKLLEYLGPEIASREPNRAHQMSTLRRVFVPQIILLLQNVLHGTGKLKECVQLADLIASEQHGLYKCFGSGEMQSFLSKLQETCRDVLDDNCDALGYLQQ